MAMNPRKKKFLDALPKHKFKVAPSAVEAGYSPQYANKNPKRILKSALKAQAEEIIEMTSANSNPNSIDMKKSLAEIVGMSRESVFERLRNIAFNEKDLSSALKVLAPLAKDLGVNLNTDEAPKTIVPILQIGVKQETPTILEVEPLDNGSTKP